MEETEELTLDEQILKTYEPMFEMTRERNLWFYCEYLNIWLSPAELKMRHAKGDCMWGAVNWKLRPPPRGYVT